VPTIISYRPILSRPYLHTRRISKVFSSIDDNNLEKNHSIGISKVLSSTDDNNSETNHSIGQVMSFLKSINNTLTNSDKNFKDFNETLSVTLKELKSEIKADMKEYIKMELDEFKSDIKADMKMELDEFKSDIKADMKMELDEFKSDMKSEFRNEISAEVDKLSKKMSSGFSDIRKSMGRIFESGMRSDLSTSAIYTSTYMQPITINSIMELVSLLPGDDEKPMSVQQQFLVARNVTKAIMVTLFTE
jgi:hypothetical protein